jgi:hypothetical protein
MEAKELRIGNLIKFPFNEKPIIVSEAVIKYCFEDNKLYDPIPLTDEWLLKLGFKLENNAYWNENVSILGLENDRYIHFDGGRVFIRTVHQLQNLFFALKGKELTLKQN